MESTQEVGTLELIELDFDHTPACESRIGCGAAATWVGITLCPCRITEYRCDSHRRQTDAWYLSIAPVVCEGCHHEFADEWPVEWRRI